MNILPEVFPAGVFVFLRLFTNILILLLYEQLRKWYNYQM